MVDIRKATKEEIARGLELLEKENIRKQRIANGEIKGGKKYSEMSQEEKDKARRANKKRTARIKLLADKAIAKGLTVTDAEIEAYMNSPK